MKIIMTLTIIHQDDKILLGMKKRGFGMGRWNGFGGKVEADESIDQAAKREIFEEVDIEVKDLNKLGIIEFSWHHKDEVLEVHIFKSTTFIGDPTESEEMRPRWFTVDNIPFKRMWADDPHWIPLFLANQKFSGHFIFDEKDQIIKHTIKPKA